MNILENKELYKLLKTSIILGIIAIVTINIISIVINKEYKDSIISSQAKIVGMMIEKYPQDEIDIVRTITKAKDINLENKGEAILAKYGYSKNINLGLFNDIVISNKFLIISLNIFTAIIILIFILICYFSHKKIYIKLNTIENWTTSILDGKTNFKITDIEEGEISKLFMSFNKVNNIITESLECVKKEKKFLVELLSDISHQLKTPLSSVILNNELLMKKELEREKQMIVLNSNEKQLLKMTMLIENLLKLAKLDAGAIKFKIKKNSLKNSILICIENLNEIATKNKVNIQINYIGNDFDLFYDKFWIEEALVNIIKNCIEHSYENSIVKIKVIEENMFKRIIIEDSGEGISEEDIPYIFDRFFKSIKSKKRDSAGIGLALAKTIIEGHNGNISVTSNLHKGTSFEIYFLHNN